MAIGFGFNKAKVLSSAEKFVQQGKLQSAVAEYQKVLKEDPNDLTVLNTIGDLYSRLGNNNDAVACFKKVADAYAAQGFTPKAIAMYRKLTKLGTPSMESLLKLADLYTQQGLYNDARGQYTVIADQCLKSGDNAQAAKIFQKILELDPENVAMQAKLADLYTKLGKKDEAKSIYLNAAQGLYARGSFDQADLALRKVLAMEPGSTEALSLAGQVAVDSGNGKKAIEYLEKIANISAIVPALLALMRAKIQIGKFEEAEPLAEKVLALHNDLQGLRGCAEGLLNSGKAEEALRLFDRFSDNFLAANPAELLNSLHASIGKIKDNSVALEILLGLYSKAGDSSYRNEVNELLAHAYVKERRLESARDIYKELSELEPENTLHAQNFRQMVARLGEDAAVRPLSPEEATSAFMVDELEHSATVVHQQYSPEVQDVILHALTDAELFSSYNQAEKALTPLESALPRAPQDVQLNQQLASLYSKLGRFADASRTCVVLAAVFGAKGFSREQNQYLEMAAKYARQGGLPETASAPSPSLTKEADGAAPKSALPAEFSASSFSEFQSEQPSAARKTAQAVPTIAEFSFDGPIPRPAVVLPAPIPVPPPVAQIDSEHDWEQMLVVDVPFQPAQAPRQIETPIPIMPVPEEIVAPIGFPQFVDEPPAAEGGPSASSISDVAEEIRFYIFQSMFEDAEAGIERLSLFAPGTPDLLQLRSELAAARPPEIAVLEVATPPLVGSAPKLVPAAPVPPPAPSILEFIFESDFAGDASPADKTPEENRMGAPSVAQPPIEEPARIPRVERIASPPAQVVPVQVPIPAPPIEAFPVEPPVQRPAIELIFATPAVQPVPAPIAPTAAEARNIVAPEVHRAPPEAPAVASGGPLDHAPVAPLPLEPSLLDHPLHRIPAEAPLEDFPSVIPAPVPAEFGLLDLPVQETRGPSAPIAASAPLPFPAPPIAPGPDEALLDLPLQGSLVDPLAAKASVHIPSTVPPVPVPVDDPLGELVLELEDALGTDFALRLPAEFERPEVDSEVDSKVDSRADSTADSETENRADTEADLDLAPELHPEFAPEVEAIESTPASVPVMPEVAVQHVALSNGSAQDAAAFAQAETGSALSDLLEAFKEDVQESQEDADPDTHYNLGVAFREMGLLDEAIGELQKVCHAIDRGDPFDQKIQAYTWLAHCLTEKGVPQAAVRWYLKALQIPGIDENSKQAIYYDLAAAHEAAGDVKAALQNFMEVYGSNIDYRDVAERIKALRS